MHISRSVAAALLTAAAVSIAPVAQAQDYFIPPQRQAAPPGRPAPAPRPAPPRIAPAPAPAPPVEPQPGPAAEAQPTPLPPVQLPPAPEVPPLPKGEAPPAAVIGVIGVPDVMRASSAAQQVEKVIGERRDKLNEDAQKEQNTWREMQQSLANDRTKLSPEQIRDRERALQERVTDAQRKFRDRNQLIQQAAQVGLAQIERTLIAVIQEVAKSRGMNIVLHRAQVALNDNVFDITDQVTTQLNKILPTVLIPGENGGPLPAIGEAKSPTDTAAAVSPAPAVGAQEHAAAPTAPPHK